MEKADVKEQKAVKRECEFNGRCRDYERLCFRCKHNPMRKESFFDEA